MCSNHLIVETVTALPLESLPAMRLYKPGELGGDPTNFWAPNVPALEVMLESFGFSNVKAMPSPVSLGHPLKRGRGLSCDQRAARPQPTAQSFTLGDNEVVSQQA
jgi:tRNA (mo5U34)-methyltransferase